MAARRRARRAGPVLALALAAVAACGGKASLVPPVPSDLRHLDQREAGCIACHDGRRAPTLDPDVIQTPMDHPPLAIVRFLRTSGFAAALRR